MREGIKRKFLWLFILVLFILIFYGLGHALLPLLLSFFLAYLVYPVIQKLEQKGISRILATSAVFVLSTTVLVCLLMVLIPQILRDFESFWRAVPTNLDRLLGKIQTIANAYGFTVSLGRAEILRLVQENSSSLTLDGFKVISQILKESLGNAHDVLLGIMNLFLFPVFFFFIILDYENILKEARSLIPNRFQKSVMQGLKKLDEILSGYIRGQLLVAGILALYYATALTIIDLNFGLLIGLMTGFLIVIPFVGFSTGLASALLIAISTREDISTILGVLAIYGCGQVLEGFFITPRIVGNRVGLKAFETMIFLIVMGNYFGLPGMLVAIPLGAFLKYLLTSSKERLAA